MLTFLASLSCDFFTLFLCFILFLTITFSFIESIFTFVLPDAIYFLEVINTVQSES